MKNKTTRLTFVQNEHLRVQTRMKAWMNEAGMMVAKCFFCLITFLSITVESNGQSMTFAENDINQTPVGVFVSGNMLTNDSDPTNDDQWIKSVRFFDELGNNHLGQIGGRPFRFCAKNGIPAGTISIYLNGDYEFNPTPTFKGKVSISYVVEDASGATDAATLVIQVIPKNNPIRNDKPIVHNDTNTTEMDTDVIGNVITCSDYDLENNVLTINEAFADVNGDGVMEESLTVGAGAVVYGKNMVGDPMMAGLITLNSDGSYNFDPIADFSGKLPIEYKVTDGNNGEAQANLTISVLPYTSNQSFANDDIIIGKMNSSQFGNIITNDQSSAYTSQIIADVIYNHDMSLVIDGTTENELRSSGSVVIDIDGSFTYSPSSGFIGTESFCYVICDNVGSEAACDTATLYLTTIPFTSTGGGLGWNSNLGIGISSRTLTRGDFTVGNTGGSTENFSLYPNPGIVSDGFINLRFKSITDKAQIQITDMNGRIVKRLTADASIDKMNNLKMDVADLMQGKYHLQLIDGANIYSEIFILIDKS